MRGACAQWTAHTPGGICWDHSTWSNARAASDGGGKGEGRWIGATGVHSSEHHSWDDLGDGDAGGRGGYNAGVVQIAAGVIKGGDGAIGAGRDCWDSAAIAGLITTCSRSWARGSAGSACASRSSQRPCHKAARSSASRWASNCCGVGDGATEQRTRGSNHDRWGSWADRDGER